MPAVVGWVAALGATTVSTVTLGTVVASWATSLVVGSSVLGLTAAQIRRGNKLKDSGDVPSVSGQTVLVKSTEVPRIIAFGETLVGGVITYLNSTGDDLRSLYMELVHTGHELPSAVGFVE